MHKVNLFFKAGVADYHESDVYIYLIPTSNFSHELGTCKIGSFVFSRAIKATHYLLYLGFTDRHYPNILSMLIVKKLPKEGIKLNFFEMASLNGMPIAVNGKPILSAFKVK